MTQPHHKLIESYLDGQQYTTYTIGHQPEDREIGIIDHHIALAPTNYKRCDIYLGQTGIVIFMETSQPNNHQLNDHTLLYADPDLKTKFQQIIQQYHNG